MGGAKSGPKMPTKETLDRYVSVYQKHGGLIRPAADELGIARSCLRTNLQKVGAYKKPIAGGTKKGHQLQAAELPDDGKIKRYILTSVQNNTNINKKVWENLKALAKYYRATIMVGTYSYNTNAYGKLAVKRGKKKEYQYDLWYAPEVLKDLRDERIELGAGLVWCGEMNILPTATDPLEGLDTYSGRKSSIIPHAKLAMKTVAAPIGEAPKLMYTTGTVTQRNYIAKRAGLVAEFHHIYGGLLVEVNSKGNWFVRQLNAIEKTGDIQDLNVQVKDGVVTKDGEIEAIVWGDLHATTVDPGVKRLASDMLDTLKPRYQFIHDAIEGTSVNHHDARKPYERFKAHLRKLTTLERELKLTAQVLNEYSRPNIQTIVVNSNHDRWIDRFLDSYDPRLDNPGNAEIYYAGNAERYAQVRRGGIGQETNSLEYLIKRFGGLDNPTITFLKRDELFKVCGKVECGMHGDEGPNGTRTHGNPKSLGRIARLMCVGDAHVAGIYSGLYVAGTSTTLKVSYNHGPSSWTHSHIIVYPSGKRCIVTMYNGAWRAEK